MTLATPWEYGDKEIRKAIGEWPVQTINISYPFYLFPLGKQSRIVESFEAKLRFGDYRDGEVEVFFDMQELP